MSRERKAHAPVSRRDNAGESLAESPQHETPVSMPVERSVQPRLMAVVNLLVGPGQYVRHGEIVPPGAVAESSIPDLLKGGSIRRIE